jgi:purine-nucleoside/S-methyl-5'-thioadenosine phosphorylase / adenosine deaminase
MSEPALPLLVPDWPAPPQVRAAVTLRGGGVSRPPFDTLNVATHTGDVPEAVAENRRRLRSALDLPAEPSWLVQEHRAQVLTLEASADPEPLRGDGAVTRSPVRVCAIQVADCMPVLFAARDGTAVGAAHAGWRGLAAGVLEATVRALGIDSSQLLAWLGPAIGPDHFEVGEDVHAALQGSDGEGRTAFAPNARGRWQCDLYAVGRARLRALGVREVYGGGWCTYAQPARFFSYRRDGRCGRMAALVWLTGTRGRADRAGRRMGP